MENEEVVDYEMSSDEGEIKEDQSKEIENESVIAKSEDSLKTSPRELKVETRKSSPREMKDEKHSSTVDVKKESCKRLHSDNSEEELKSLRQSRRRKAIQEDPVLEETDFSFARHSERLDEVQVYQSDFDTFRKFESKFDLKIPGYEGKYEQIVRLLYLYKFKRFCRDGGKGATVMLKNMKENALINSWNSMTKLLKCANGYEYNSHVMKKETQRDTFSHGGNNLKRDVHYATLYKQNFCLVQIEEKKCHECTTHLNTDAIARMKGGAMCYSDFTSEELRIVRAYQKILDDQRAKRAKANANASPRSVRVRRGYLTREQDAEATSPVRVDNQATGHDTRKKVSSSYDELSRDDQQRDLRSTADRHSNQSTEVDRHDERNEVRSSLNIPDDLDEAFDRIRSLENKFYSLQEKYQALADAKSSFASSSAASTALPDEIDRRLSRLEAKIAEVGQNGAEQREKLSSRVTEVQSSQIRIESRIGSLSSDLEKVREWNKESVAKSATQRVELNKKLLLLESLERKVRSQKSLVEKCLDNLLQKTSDLPPVVSFSATQEEKKRVEAIRHEIEESQKDDTA